MDKGDITEGFNLDTSVLEDSLNDADKVFHVNPDDTELVISVIVAVILNGLSMGIQGQFVICIR